MLHRLPCLSTRPCGVHQCVIAARRTKRLLSASAVAQDRPTSTFPFKDEFHLETRTLDSETVIQLLSSCMTAERLKRIEKVAKHRTFQVCPVVEGVYDMGNLAAVCRSADAMGVGTVQCITKGDKYKQSHRTSAGADKWLEVGVWSDTTACLTHLKQRGYRIAVTHLHADTVPIQELDWSLPTAFVLGNERRGVSEEAMALADCFTAIPMSGFVESFNISVAAALVMYEAQQQRLRRLGSATELSQAQQRVVQAQLMLRTVNNSKSALEEMLSRLPPSWQAHHFKETTRA